MRIHTINESDFHNLHTNAHHAHTINISGYHRLHAHTHKCMHAHAHTHERVGRQLVLYTQSITKVTSGWQMKRSRTGYILLWLRDNALDLKTNRPTCCTDLSVVCRCLIIFPQETKIDLGSSLSDPCLFLCWGALGLNLHVFSKTLWKILPYINTWIPWLCLQEYKIGAYWCNFQHEKLSWLLFKTGKQDCLFYLQTLLWPWNGSVRTYIQVSSYHTFGVRNILLKVSVWERAPTIMFLRASVISLESHLHYIDYVCDPLAQNQS